MGPICSTFVHSQIHLHYVQYLFPIGPAVLALFPGFWIVEPLTPPPPMSPWGIVGRIVLAYVHSQMNPQTCTKFGVNRSIRLVAFPDLNVWPPKTPRNAPFFEGWIVFSYVYSKTNPQTCTKCGANRRSRLTASPYIWICDPLNPPPPNVPWGIVGRLAFSLCLFQDESADVNQSWCQSVLPFDSFPWLLNVDPLKPPKCPLVSLEAIYLANIHSLMNMHMCTKFGANRSSRFTSSPDFWMCDPYPPSPIVEGQIVFSLCPFPNESADVYQIWC